MPYRTLEDSVLGNPTLTTVDQCEKDHPEITSCNNESCPVFPHCPKAVRRPITSTIPHGQPRTQLRIETGEPKP